MLAELLALKLFVAIAVVLVLTIIAEKMGPKTAGILSGLPTGSAITLFFIGLQNGTTFASDTAIYNMVGIIAMQATLFAYFLASSRLKSNSLPLSALFSLAAYFLSIYILHLFSFDIFWAVLLPLLSIVAFTYLFKGIEETKIEKPVKLGFRVLAFRAVVAGIIILIVIEAAGVVGPQWAGLFTAFPTTTFPLILILHHTYDARHVHTLIKNFPVGLASLVAYSLTVYFAYPLFGIFYGTLAAFAAALAVCALIFFFPRKKQSITV